MSARSRRIAIACGLTFAGTAAAVPSIVVETTIGPAEGYCDPVLPQSCEIPPFGNTVVSPGEDLVVAYKVTNTGTDTLTRHDLSDSALGVLLTDFGYTLQPGSFGFLAQRFTAPMTLGQTSRSGTWTARAPGVAPVSDSDTYGFLVVTPKISLRVTLAPAATACTNPNDLATCTLPTTTTTPYVAGQRLVIGFEVTNTGIATMLRHDLLDDSLGPILTDFPYTLEPGLTGYILQFQTPPAPFMRSARWTARTATGYEVFTTRSYEYRVPSLFADGFEYSGFRAAMLSQATPNQRVELRSSQRILVAGRITRVCDR